MDDHGGCGNNKSYKKWIKIGTIPSAIVFVIVCFIRSGISPQELITVISSNPFVLLIVCFAIICICVAYVAVKWHDDRTKITLNKNNQEDNKRKISELEEKLKKCEEDVEKLTNEKNKLFSQNEEKKQKIKYMKKQIEDLKKINSTGDKQGSENKIIKMNQNKEMENIENI